MDLFQHRLTARWCRNLINGERNWHLCGIHTKQKLLQQHKDKWRHASRCPCWPNHFMQKVICLPFSTHTPTHTHTCTNKNSLRTFPDITYGSLRKLGTIVYMTEVTVIFEISGPWSDPEGFFARCSPSCKETKCHEHVDFREVPATTMQRSQAAAMKEKW